MNLHTHSGFATPKCQATALQGRIWHGRGPRYRAIRVDVPDGFTADMHCPARM